MTPTGKVVKTFAPKVAGHVAYLAGQLPGHAGRASRGWCRTPKGTATAPSPASPSSSFPLAGKTGTATHQRAAAQLVVRGLGPGAEPPVPDRGGDREAVATAPRPPPRWSAQGFEYLVAQPEWPRCTLAPPTAPAARCLPDHDDDHDPGHRDGHRPGRDHGHAGEPPPDHRRPPAPGDEGRCGRRRGRLGRAPVAPGPPGAALDSAGT